MAHLVIYFGLVWFYGFVAKPIHLFYCIWVKNVIFEKFLCTCVFWGGVRGYSLQVNIMEGVELKGIERWNQKSPVSNQSVGEELILNWSCGHGGLWSRWEKDSPGKFLIFSKMIVIGPVFFLL